MRQQNSLRSELVIYTQSNIAYFLRALIRKKRKIDACGVIYVVCKRKAAEYEYTFAVYESERHICIFFYKSSEQSKIIYTANCEKKCRHCYDVHFGYLEQVWEYDDEPDNGERKVSDYSYTAISQYTEDEVVQALNEVNKNINLEYEYEDTRIYFDNIAEIIKFHTEKYNCTKIE